MTNEFIPYEQALALKELGFDEPCIALYNEECKTLHLSLNLVNKKPYFCAPLYQQAFRWFREKYGLCLVIKLIHDMRFDLGYSLSKNGLIIGAYTTYEKAELACLKKLIEISTPTA